MVIAITGASGFIGRRLVAVFSAAGHEVRALGRHAAPDLPPGVRHFPWDPMAGPPPEDSLRGAAAVVHLAGEPVAQRWTEAARRRILDSRVLGTRHLVAGIAAMERRPEVLAAASAVGYYGSRGEEDLPETSKPGHGWLSDVCVKWEREASAASDLGVRVVAVRIGLVLDPGGGALGRMLPAFRRGLGARMGNGRQWMPWIHMEDLAWLFRFVVETPVEGAVNGAAPHPVTNGEFTRMLARAAGRRAVLGAPGLVLQLLFGEMADVLLASQRALPQAALVAGFRFRYPELEGALANLLGQASAGPD